MAILFFASLESRVKRRVALGSLHRLRSVVHIVDMHQLTGALLDIFFEPFTAGQIILRPRFVARKFPARRFEGNLIPTIPPSNSWIVEVLGIEADHEMDGRQT